MHNSEFDNYDNWLCHNKYEEEDDDDEDDDYEGGLVDYKYEQWLDSQYEQD